MLSASSVVHRGHLALVQYLLAQGVVEEVWLMVSPLNPLKSSLHLSPDDVRLDMARTAAAEVPGLRVSDFEMHLPRPSYTWRTLHALRAAYPDTEFSLIIGADNWLVFDRWQHTDEILAHHRLIIYPRRLAARCGLRGCTAVALQQYECAGGSASR